MIYSKDSQIFLIQVDHLSGEQIGQCINHFYKIGANSVQVISTVTKKNRPGWIILINCKKEYNDAVEKCIVQELNVGGWHQIKTIHHYLHDEKIRHPINIILKKSKITYQTEIVGKRFDGNIVRPEHDNTAKIQEQINTQYGVFIPYNTLYHLIAAALLNDNQDQIIIPL